MSQTVHLEVFYPHPPERVWQVLTDRRILADWMMANNFEPKVGHRFQFYSQPLPGLQTTIHCEVVELEAPSRLVYTWKESPTAQSSLVIWTLTAVPGGTHLRLKHHQYSALPAVAAFHDPGAIARSYQPSARFDPAPYPDPEGSGAAFPPLPRCSRDQLRPSRSTATLASPECQPVAWDYFLNQRLPMVFRQDEPSVP